MQAVENDTLLSLCVNYKNENVKTVISCICVLRVQSTEMHKCADVQCLQSGIANYWPDVYITAFLTFLQILLNGDCFDDIAVCL